MAWVLVIIKTISCQCLKGPKMGGGKKPKHTFQTCWVSIKLTLLYKRVRFRIIWLKQEMLFSPLDTETFCFPQPNSNHWRGNLSVSYKYCQWKIGLEGKSYCFLKEREYIYNFCTLWIFKDILKESSFYTPPPTLLQCNSHCETW